MSHSKDANCNSFNCDLQHMLNINTTTSAQLDTPLSESTCRELKQVQHRLLTFKELLLHGETIDSRELKKLKHHMLLPEQEVVELGMASIDHHIHQIDLWLNQHQHLIEPLRQHPCI